MDTTTKGPPRSDCCITNFIKDVTGQTAYERRVWGVLTEYTEEVKQPLLARIAELEKEVADLRAKFAEQEFSAAERIQELEWEVKETAEKYEGI